MPFRVSTKPEENHRWKDKKNTAALSAAVSS